jgi:inner membrane protein
MPSYKKHILFSLVMALPFFPDVFYLSLAVIGTSIIDFDHHLKIKNLFIMGLVGILLTLLLYLLKLPLILGFLLIFLALIFLICKDRGFMHSIFGIVLASFILTMFIIDLYFLIFNYTQNILVIQVIILSILGFLSLNKKLLAPFIVLVVIGIILLPNLQFNIYSIFGALFLGFLSHITLDLLTPNGVGLFNPLSSKKFHKITGLVILGFWILLVVIFLFLNMKIL